MTLSDLLRRCAGLLPALLVFIVSATLLPAQTQPDTSLLQQQIEELRRSQEATQKELAELKETLEPLLSRLPQPFRPQNVSVAGSQVKGKASARVTMIEFSDLQCPFCEKYYQETFPAIVKEFVDTGKVRYVMREFPLTQIHPQAQAASSAALCAGKQDKYWEMRDRILSNREKLSGEDLASYAAATGLDVKEWANCLDTDIYAEKVAADLEAGIALGVNGTPAFAIGLTDPDDPDTVRATKLIEGAYPFQAFQEAIEELLKSTP